MKAKINPILVFAFLFGSLFLPGISGAQNQAVLKEEAALKIKLDALGDRLRESLYHSGERANELSPEQLFEKAEWILIEFSKWKIRYPNGKKKPDIVPLEPRIPETDPDPFAQPIPSKNREPDPFGNTNPLKADNSLSEYDFSFTLQSIFESLLFTESDGGLSSYISLAKKYPILRSEPGFNSLINNFLIAGNILGIIGKETPINSIPKAKDDLPVYLAKARPDLQSAWSQGRFIENTILSHYQGDKENEISYAYESQTFNAIISECLIDENWKNADKIRDFVWDDSCGFGSEEFSWPQINFLAIYGYHKGKPGEGLSFFLQSWLSSGQLPFIYFGVDNRRWNDAIKTRLEHSKLHWESAACGLLLIESWLIDSHRFQETSASGTARILSQLKAIQLPDSFKTGRVLEVLNRILQRHFEGTSIGAIDPFASSGIKLPLDPNTKEHVIQAITALMKVAESPSVQCKSIKLLTKYSQASTLGDDLRQMVSSPVPSISEEAILALSKKGYSSISAAPSTIVAQTEEYDLTFRLNGRPLSKLPVRFSLALIRKDGKSHSSSGGWFDVTHLNDKGGKFFKREDSNHASDVRGIVSVFAARGDDKFSPIPWKRDTPIFAFAESFANIKKREDGIIDIPIAPLTLVLEFPKNRIPKPGSKASSTVVFRAQALPLAGIGSEHYLGSSDYIFESTKKTVLLERATPGRYRFRVQAPGCSIYSQEKPVFHTQKQRVVLKLEPGFELKYSFGEGSDEKYSVALWRSAMSKRGYEKWDEISEIDVERQFFHNWAHLGTGKYKLGVFAHRNGREEQKTIDFEIKQGAPRVQDLGNISIP